MIEDELLTYKAAAAWLGLKPGTIYSMVSRREIPHVRLGKRLVRFSRAELDAWLRARSVAVAPASAARGQG